MKKILVLLLSLTLLRAGCGTAAAEAAQPAHRVLYQGHGSLRIETAEGKVIYIDPYAGDDYDLTDIVGVFKYPQCTNQYTDAAKLSA